MNSNLCWRLGLACVVALVTASVLSCSPRLSQTRNDISLPATVPAPAPAMCEPQGHSYETCILCQAETETHDRTSPGEPLVRMRVSGKNADQFRQLRHTRSLTRVELTGTALKEDVFRIVRDLQSVRQLCMDRTRTDVQQLAALAARMPHVQRVEITFCPDLSDDAAAALAGFKGLRELRLQYTGIGPMGLSRLRSLTQLETLDYRQCKNVGDAELTAIAGLRSLRSLRIGVGSFSAAGVRRLRALPNLRQLSLFVMDDDLVPGIAVLQALESLDLSASHITDGGLAALQGLPNLRDLDVRHTRLTPEGLTRLGQFPRLCSLVMEGAQFERLTGDQVRRLGNIRHLRLSWATLASIRRCADLPSLTSLDVQSIAEPSDVEVLGLIANLTNLESLNVRVQEEHVVHLRRLPKLQRLSLAHARLTDACLPSFRGFAALKTLDVSGTEISAAGLWNLQQQLVGMTLYCWNTASK